jgi:Flp pilus assembly protein TadD
MPQSHRVVTMSLNFKHRGHRDAETRRNTKTMFFLFLSVSALIHRSLPLSKSRRIAARRIIATVANGDGNLDPQSDSSKSAIRFAQIGLIVAMLLAFSPVFVADFSSWDDNYNIAENPRLNPPAWQSVSYFWTHPIFDLYIPMTYSVWAVLAKVSYVAQPDADGWHLNPYIFHAANVCVHAASALLVFSILRKLVSGQILPAWIGAMVFAIHPVQVESVAWIAGMKDVLAGMFALAALRLYLEEGSIRRQRICFGLAILSLLIAMLCKPIAMVIPVIGAAVDLILQRRSIRQITTRLVMWIPLTVACAIVAQHSQPPKFSETFIPILSRPLVAGDALAFYLWKILWPLSLGIDYGRTPSAVLSSHMAYLTCLVPVGLAMVLWFNRRRWKCSVAGAAIFVIALLPMLGLMPFDFQKYSTVADHYLYLPMLGIALIAARIVAVWRGRAANSIGVVVLVMLMVRTLLQSQVWQNSYSLFSHAVQINPRSWVSHENLSITLADRNDLAGAKEHAQIAMQLKPDFADAYANLAHLDLQSGDVSGAIDVQTQAVKLSPNNSEYRTSLGHALSAAGQIGIAIQAYRDAQRLSPDDPNTSVNLASALAESGQFDEAIQWYQAALRIDSGSADAKAGLARATVERDRRASTQR